ncbi:hypothetical protein SAMN04488503_1583 [Humidesulfovibrio mexicanus]|uniref:Uncharacterized protein n=1 Tax=Humidesulfovibrio mexicanus TaxID=147047 RepID=A0A238ZSP9_9BACT|nr:hypothetical protein [Humidesulfovibrio mexicanus]SNR86466.1 hypothetical protein SAMN04488503_1583 [Humidesulfovibrio mexicanus]
MGADILSRKTGHILFTVAVDGESVRGRKAVALPARPHADKRRKPPRHRPDHLLDNA